MSGMSSFRVKIVTTMRYNAVDAFNVGTRASFGSRVANVHPSEIVWRTRMATKLRRRPNLTRRIYPRGNLVSDTQYWRGGRGSEVKSSYTHPRPKLWTINWFTRRDIFGSCHIEWIVLLFALQSFELDLSLLFRIGDVDRCADCGGGGQGYGRRKLVVWHVHRRVSVREAGGNSRSLGYL